MPVEPPKVFTHEIFHSKLEDGTNVCIRSVRPSDKVRMREGIGQLSDQSRYLRFFSGQPMPPDSVVERLVDVDGHRHLAWGAILTDVSGQPAIGAVHAVREGDVSKSAEFSIAIVDEYQGLGLARMLIAVLLVNCQIEHVATLNIQVLSENRVARRLVKSLGGERQKSEFSVTDYTLDRATALARLRADQTAAGLQTVFAALARYV